MGLVDLRTDLKSLRFGKDRVGGGSSNQPYKTRPIPDSLSGTDVTGGPDFLLRGGTLALRNSVRDVSRLSQMFFDFKSPNGPLFTVKQNVLSRTNVNTQASPIAFNDGVYLPTSTIAQAGVNALGIHLNKQGIDPTGLTAKTGILVQPNYSNHLEDIKEISTNRLVQLKFEKIGKFIQDPNENEISQSANSSNSPSGEGIGKNNISLDNGQLLKYPGGPGPGSILGIGSTVIKRYYNTANNLDFTEKSNESFKDQNFITLDSNQLAAREASKSTPTIKPDFRIDLTPPDSGYSNLPRTLDYQNENIETRVNLGNPGKKGNKSSYELGKDRTNRPLDKLNALPLYKSSGVIQDPIKNDLVKFRIGVIDNDNPNQKTYIHFRAFIDSMSDSYSSNWNSMDFVGRGEKLYRYGGGFNRSLNLAWTVAAQSKDELIPMYQKLNYLASIVSPDYSSDGYMRGNLITLTLGGWFFEQIGFIEGITYDVPQESPWEIAIPGAEGTARTAENIRTDNSVKEMPHIIKVTGFKFTPIQSFLPKVQQNNYKNSTFEGVNSNFISSYGKERFIQLAKAGNGGKSVVDNYGSSEDGSESGGSRNYIPQSQ